MDNFKRQQRHLKKLKRKKERIARIKKRSQTAKHLMKKIHFHPSENVLSSTQKKGGENMTDEQKKRLSDLQALETLAEEEKPVLEALVALETADKTLADVKAATPVDPIAVAQKAFDDALQAYTDAEAAFQATQNASTPDTGATPASTDTTNEAGQQTA